MTDSGPLVRWLTALAAIGQVSHEFPSPNPDGVGGQVDPIVGPDARTLRYCQFLTGGLSRTQRS
jgi:hypothetical protein